MAIFFKEKEKEKKRKEGENTDDSDESNLLPQKNRLTATEICCFQTLTKDKNKEQKTKSFSFSFFFFFSFYYIRGLLRSPCQDELKPFQVPLPESKSAMDSSCFIVVTVLALLISSL